MEHRINNFLAKNEKRILIILLCVLILVWTIDMFLLLGYRVLIQPPFGTMSVADMTASGELSDEYLQMLNKLPPQLIHSFIVNKWHLCIECEFQLGIIHFAGFGGTSATSYGDKTIHLERPDSTFHEFGHYLQYIRPIPEWGTIYQQEAAAAASVLGDYAKKNQHEYFAECFSFFISTQGDKAQRTKLAEVAPATTSLLTALENENWKLPTKAISIQPIPTIS